MSSSTDPKYKPVQKHRACDECRSRKAACSKEDSGCSRCRRENIACVYSEQKPMGRPRKRKCVEQVGGDVVEPVQQAVIPQMPDPNGADFDFNFGLLDVDFGVLNNEFFFDGELFNDSYMFGQYQSNEVSPFEPQAIPLAKRHEEMGIENGAATATENGAIWHFGIEALPPNVNFGISLDSGSSNDPDGISLNQATTPPSPFVMDYGPILELPPQENSSSQEEKSLQCSCLPSLYLALASLQVLPTDITLAMSTIRQAAYTAQTAIRCKNCSTCPITESSPPITSLQNSMLIGTLLPVIADGYKRLLKMIDDRYTSASQSNSKLLFHPGSYGGFKTITSQTCDASLVEPKDMEPEEWRASTRALLRADVYGIDEKYGGLKGLIREMEVRQRTRHAQLDRLREEGLLSLVEEKLCLGEKDRTCEKILDLARNALENLVVA